MVDPSFPSPLRTRFAPSPTGLLHLGHVAHAVYVWGVARAHGGTVVLRLEDHDRGRFRPEYERAILRDLEWLGLIPDVGTVDDFRTSASPYRQSDCDVHYRRIVERLRDQGLVYACDCSRADIAMGGTSQPGKEAVYGGRCRDRRLSEGQGRGLRVKLPAGQVRFHDQVLGPQTQHPTRQCGDMLIRDRVGHWTYQFCVTVDDLMQGITTVIRGEDLLSSTGRQLALRALLGADDEMTFFHHPLIRDANGRKLSKRDGDLGLKHMREQGMSPREILGRAAFLVGLSGVDEPISPDDVALLFRASAHHT